MRKAPENRGLFIDPFGMPLSPTSVCRDAQARAETVPRSV